MKLILSPKDNLGKMTLKDVQSFALEGDTLLVVFENGRTRNYPLIHLWYYESHVDYHRTQPLVELVEEEDEDDEDTGLPPIILKKPVKKKAKRSIYAPMI